MGCESANEQSGQEWMIHFPSTTHHIPSRETPFLDIIKKIKATHRKLTCIQEYTDYNLWEHGC